tara:strand:- start:8693 stop:9490 length:798 start_codon:yes stop_codon:yes gene_type:complete
MISIVIFYHKKEQYLNSVLLKSLKKQKGKYELIVIDKNKKEFNSGLSALNYGGAKANGKYLMFMHLDVELTSNTWLRDSEKILDSMKNWGAAGVIGMSKNGANNRERGRNIVTHKVPPRNWEWGNEISKPERVQTLDECLLIVPKSVFKEVKFDERVCGDWHLYVVEYCLQCLRKGLGVYSIPMHIYHVSKNSADIKKGGLKMVRDLGSLDPNYYVSLKKVLKKHKRHFKKIYTTCGDWSTRSPLILQRAHIIGRRGLKYLAKKV